MKWHRLILMISILFILSEDLLYAQGSKKSTLARAEATSKPKAKKVTSPHQKEQVVTVDPKSIRLYKVDSIGWVYNLRGLEIGRLTPRGMVYDSDGRRMGNIVQGKQIRDANLKLLGHVSDEGLVIDLGGNVLGMILADGTVKDSMGNTLAVLEGDLKGQGAAFLFFFR